MTDGPERFCLTCGKPHVQTEIPNTSRPPQHPKNMVTWADPDDGHVYAIESWEQVARRLWDELNQVPA